MRNLICSECTKTFEALDQDNPMKAALGGTDESICYSCALKRITGDRAPEEGDFNSARIISGEMSELEWRWLQEDLRAVEEGRSIREYEEERNPDWCYDCCYHYLLCTCDD